MHFVSEDIEKYCVDHSVVPSTHCRKIEEYTRQNVPHSVMLIGPLEGSFLASLVRLTRARRVLEIGCYTGYSALAMAEALPADGELITLDINPETNALARGFWDQSPQGKKIRSIVAPALQTLETLSGKFDLVFIDADKPNYTAYLKKTLDLLSEGGLIVADNTLFGGEVLDAATTDENGKGMRAFNEYLKANRERFYITQLPVRDGMTLIQKR